jgi:iron complex outermembrane recepter protein
VMNVSYTKQEPIFAGDRDISAVPFSGIPANITGSGTTPFGRFGFGTAGNRLPTAAPFNGGAGRLTYDPSVAGNYRVFGDDAYNFAPVNYLLTPQERTSLFVQGRYAVTDNISFKTEVLYNERQSAQELAANPLTFGLAGSGVARFTIPANAVTNPFGQDITFASFRPTNFPRHFAQDVDTFRFGGGFDGSFDLADRSFSWDVNYVYSQNETHTRADGLYNLDQLRAGLTCTAAQAATGACLPLDIYHGAEAFTQAMVNYAGFVQQDNQESKLHNYSANITGDVFELPAGPLGFAAGYEYRRESGFDQPDALVASGRSTGNIRQPTTGGFSLDEFYVEFNIPVLKDLPGAEVLEFSLAARYSDYSTFGDTTNGKFGFRWKPIADLLVRGNYSEGFRAPNIGELFSGQSDSFPQLADPCSIQLGPGGVIAYTPVGTPVEAGCRAAGVPVGTYQQSNPQIRITVGSNPNLQPENAVTKTLGLVYSPSYVEGLDFYLDWYNIKLTNTIAAFGGSFIINQCALDPTQTSSFCSSIVRDSGGNVVDLLAAGVNAGVYDLEGYDFTASYKWDTSFGKFRVNWDSSYISKYTQEVPKGSGATSVVGNYFTFAPFWQLKSNIDLAWQYADFGATLGARYLSALDEDCFNAEARGFDDLCAKPGIESPIFYGAENTIDDVWYFDLQGTWDAPWNARVTAGVNNVFDEDPPVAYSAFANSFDPQYEVPGRFWYVQYTQKF